MQQEKQQDMIARVRQMEQYLDEVLEAMHSCPEAIGENIVIQGRIQELMQYYDGGQWLQDYQADENRELPTDLKRGVLAQDTLYNLFCEIKEQSMSQDDEE